MDGKARKFDPPELVPETVAEAGCKSASPVVPSQSEQSPQLADVQKEVVTMRAALKGAIRAQETLTRTLAALDASLQRLESLNS